MFRFLRSASLAISLLLALSAVAAEPRHDLLRVPLTDPAAADYLRLHQGELDIVFVKPGVEAHIAAGPGDEAMLRAAGLLPEVMRRDMEQAAAYPDKGAGFGIYHTYSESVAFMDSLTALYPNVVSAKWSIGTTYQGRDIWAYRISDNPGVDESEPEILIDGMHHAREIMASEFPIMFAEYLATHYGVDPQITWLVDNRELYLVPIVNPDGMVRNETTNPAGGGMWRKNLSPQAGGQFGVDLNRNYPYNWGYDDLGSSPTPADITYRGPSPASELETQAMINFVNGREIITHDSVHTYSELTLFPWGYATVPTADNAAFEHLARGMTAQNDYQWGQPGNVLYEVNGGVFDTFYGVTTDHAAIFSMSNEIGNTSDGFWPLESRRGALFQDNLEAHLFLMRAAGTSITAHSAVAEIAGGSSGTLSFSVENESVVSSALNVGVTVRTDDPWIQLLAADRNVGNVPAMGTVTLAGDPIPFTVDPACPAGHQVQLDVTVHMSDGDLTHALSFAVDVVPPVLSEDFEGSLAGWTLSGAWNTTTTQSHSPTHSLTDTPAGNYTNDSESWAQLNGVWRASTLRFWHRYATEPGYDLARVQISADGGAWTNVASYSGTLAVWTPVAIDLGAFAGQDLALRFLLSTDESVIADGWYLDDVELDGPVSTFTMAAPVALGPLGDAATGPQPSLTVAAVDGASVYGFRVYGDALGTDLIASADNIAGTSWTTPELLDGSYWWRAWAGDGTNRSALSPAEPFNVAYASAVTPGSLLTLRVLGGVGGNGSRFALSLPARADVSVDIHDARGARVRRLFSGTLEGGERTLSWDGRDGHGRAASSGVYFVRAVVGGRPLTGRVVIVR